MKTITSIKTAKGPLYLTKREKSKLAAYTKRLEEYEKSLFRKYGKEYMLRITPTEYKTAMRLHNEVFKLTQKVKRNQKSLKKLAKK